MYKEPGFTLVELLITIVVLTIVLAAGVPAFQSFIKNNRVTAQANDLVSTIQLARSEALKRGTNTVVCASDDQAKCTGKDTWSDGWIVF
jgi:type IV fimbrial biogenesis protein FimT